MGMPGVPTLQIEGLHPVAELHDVGVRMLCLNHHPNFHLSAAWKALCRIEHALRCFRIERLRERFAHEQRRESDASCSNFENLAANGIVCHVFLPSDLLMVGNPNVATSSDRWE
jgi:hypothetical protein